MNPPMPGDIGEEQVLCLLAARRKRAEIFGEDIFSDPAWDIVLELFAAELGDRRVRLEDLAPIAPKSVLARWVGVLEERGLVECVGRLDPSECWIQLSRDCAAKLSAFLSHARHRAGFG